MTIWVIFAALTAATVAALVFGARTVGRLAAGSANSGHLAVYKHQLAEIDADLARGLIGVDEAKSHHAEVSRRLLAAAQETDVPYGATHRWIGFVAALLVPALAFAIYARVGAPALPDMPQAQRLAVAEAENDLEAMVYKVEKHLAQKPDDAAGWEILIPSYQSMGRYADAAEAHRRLIAIKGPTADRLANLAEMLVFQGNGLMPKEGAKAAQEALKLDPWHSKARYYGALALAQDGRKVEALARFEALLADAPPDAPFRAQVQHEIENLKVTEGVSADEQQQMIKGMVDGLAIKLESDPKNLEGWLRLIRARVVLKEVEAAKTSLAAARLAFSAERDALAQLDALAKDLNLQ